MKRLLARLRCLWTGHDAQVGDDGPYCLRCDWTSEHV